MSRAYKVEAKRYPTDKDWTDWATVDNYAEAQKQIGTIRSLGYCGRIIDKSGIVDAVKLIEEEYDKAQNLTYVKNPLAYALYSVWKKIDKEDKVRCKKLN